MFAFITVTLTHLNIEKSCSFVTETFFQLFLFTLNLSVLEVCQKETNSCNSAVAALTSELLVSVAVAGIKSGLCDVKNHRKLVVCVVMLLTDFEFRILTFLHTILEPLHVMHNTGICLLMPLLLVLHCQ